jgi:hypothetical protein
LPTPRPRSRETRKENPLGRLRTTLNHHLDRLVDAGLVTVYRLL